MTSPYDNGEGVGLMSKKRKFTVAIDGCGEIIIEVTQALLDKIMGEEWRSCFYTFSDENEAIITLADWMVRFPPDFKGEHHLDGLCGFTADDLSIVHDGIDFQVLWEDATVTED